MPDKAPDIPIKHEKIQLKDSDGVIVQEATMLGNVLDGETILYANRRIVARLLYRNGKQEGESVYYSEVGDVTMRSHYHEGKLNGEVAYFDHAGKAYRRETYAGGQLNGRRTDFYPNGKAREISRYSDGLLNGEVVLFDMDGKITQVTCYVKGRPVPCPPHVIKAQQEQVKLFTTKKLITG